MAAADPEDMSTAEELLAIGMRAAQGDRPASRRTTAVVPTAKHYAVAVGHRRERAAFRSVTLSRACPSAPGRVQGGVPTRPRNHSPCMWSWRIHSTRFAHPCPV
jgi:hypothetical protein